MVEAEESVVLDVADIVGAGEGEGVGETVMVNAVEDVGEDEGVTVETELRIGDSMVGDVGVNEGVIVRVYVGTPEMVISGNSSDGDGLDSGTDVPL